MKNVDYVFNPKAVKMLDNHSLIVLMLSLESLKKDFLAKAENETDKRIMLLYLKELIEEVLSGIIICRFTEATNQSLGTVERL